MNDMASSDSDPDATPTVVDVSHLPSVVFGHEALTWWATVGFIVVEGSTLAVLATSLLYLRVNADSWPPRPWPPPSLTVASINVVLILATIWPMRRARHAAFTLDAPRVARWLLVATLCSVASTGLRVLEFDALRVRWNTNAYGSVAWALLTSHTLLLVTDLLETAVMWRLFASGAFSTRHFSDVEDAAVYQQFLSLSWLLLFAVLFLLPRVWS